MYIFPVKHIVQGPSNYVVDSVSFGLEASNLSHRPVGVIRYVQSLNILPVSHAVFQMITDNGQMLGL